MNAQGNINHKSIRRTSILVGVLYIIGTAAGVTSMIVTGPVLNAPDLLGAAAANPNALVIGSLLVLLMGLVLVPVPVLMFPILKKLDEVSAAGYLVFRGALEGVSYLPWIFSWLLLVTLGQEYAKAGAVGATTFHLLTTLILRAGDWSGIIGYFLFSTGAAIFYAALFRFKLIPRWISVWGLIAVVLYVAEALFAIFGLELEWLFMPMLVQEMVMAVWFIVKGFNPDASRSAKSG